MPIERAVPATWSFAISMSSVLRSFSLVFAISSIWSIVTEATTSRPARCAPLATPAAWRNSTGVGGVFKMNEKDRSS